jgi:hypothetical protein
MDIFNLVISTVELVVLDNFSTVQFKGYFKIRFLKFVLTTWFREIDYEIINFYEIIWTLAER